MIKSDLSKLRAKRLLHTQEVVGSNPAPPTIEVLYRNHENRKYPNSS